MLGVEGGAEPAGLDSHSGPAGLLEGLLGGLGGA